MRNFRILSTLYGIFFLTLGIWGEFVFLSSTAGLITSVVIALVGLFIVVMGLSPGSASRSRVKAWEPYLAIFILTVVVSFVNRLDITPILFGLIIGIFVFLVHMFCLAANLCREKYSERHRY